MNERINIQDIIDHLAERHGMSKQNADGFVKEFFLLIEQALESDRYVKIKGLGTFKLIDVESRESVKVNTGERFQIEGHTKISFTPDPALREVINKPFSCFESVALNENTILNDTVIEESEDDAEEVVEGEKAAAQVVEQPAEQTTEKPTEEVVKEIVETVVEPKQPTAEEIIAAELQQSNVQFKRVLLEEVKSQPVVVHPVWPIQSVEPMPPIEPAQFIPPAQATPVVRKSPIPYLVAIIFLVLLLSGSALLFIYYPDLFSSAKKELAQVPDPKPVTPQKVLLDTVVVVKDTVLEVADETKEVSVKKVMLNEKKEAPAKTVIATESPIKSTAITYKIAGTKATYVLKEGDTLVRLAERFYGSKELWPYIVQHNRDVIKNPDQVPYGTTLKIPELVKR